MSLYYCKAVLQLKVLIEKKKLVYTAIALRWVDVSVNQLEENQMRRSFTYRNIKDEKKKKIKTHCLAGRNYRVILSPKECQFLTK